MQPQLYDNDESQKDGHFQNYTDYSKSLRAWLVAYGVGGPILFLTNERLADRVSTSGYADWIIGLFLAGVALQILVALVNKWCAWHMYRGAGDQTYQGAWRYSIWCRINSWSWFDFWLDLISVVVFVTATWLVLGVFLVP